MSPRPRKVDDAAILEAAQRAMAAHGPARFRLADVASEAGLAPATLVQRFGSKRGLLLALASEGVAHIDACFAAVRARHRSPLRALLAAATEMPRHTRSPEELANHLAFLQVDISDPDFYRHMLELSRRTRAGYRALLDDAVAANELVRCDTSRLARLVEALAGGSLVNWAVYREGTAESWVRADLEALLAPLRLAKRRRAASANRRPSSPLRTRATQGRHRR